MHQSCIIHFSLGESVNRVTQDERAVPRERTAGSARDERARRDGLKRAVGCTVVTMTKCYEMG